MSDDLVELLCPAERTRAERMRSEHSRRLWSRAHGVLRALLGRYLQSDPRGLRFAAGAHGKPALLDDRPGAAPGRANIGRSLPGSGRMSFSLSHSGGLALYAFSRAGQVGVDLQVRCRPIDEIAVARRAFGRAEACRLRELDPATREREFLRAWVRHEAELKRRGVGVFAGAGGGSPSGCSPDGALGWEPSILELAVGPRAAAAIAVRTPPRELHCWNWQTSAEG